MFPITTSFSYAYNPIQQLFPPSLSELVKGTSTNLSLSLDLPSLASPFGSVRDFSISFFTYSPWMITPTKKFTSQATPNSSSSTNICHAALIQSPLVNSATISQVTVPSNDVKKSEEKRNEPKAANNNMNAIDNKMTARVTSKTELRAVQTVKQESPISQVHSAVLNLPTICCIGCGRASSATVSKFLICLICQNGYHVPCWPKDVSLNKDCIICPACLPAQAKLTGKQASKSSSNISQSAQNIPNNIIDICSPPSEHLPAEQTSSVASHSKQSQVIPSSSLVQSPPRNRKRSDFKLFMFIHSTVLQL